VISVLTLFTMIAASRPPANKSISIGYALL